MKPPAIALALALSAAVPWLALAPQRAAVAAEAETDPASMTREELIRRASELREQATRARRDAAARRTSEEADCQRRFFVVSCMEAARERHRESVVEARQLESRAMGLERRARMMQLEQREAEAQSRREANEERAAEARQAQEAKQRAAEAREAERERQQAERQRMADPPQQEAK